MTRRLTTEEAKWLVDNCLPEHAVSAAPGWPPGGFFRRILGGKMRDNGQLETAYLMLEPGKHLCLKVQEPESIPTRYSTTVYHGTSLGALEKIMVEGFRPSRGAGSDEVGKKYGCSLPMVYTSGLLETAHGYVGNADNGQRIGSGERLGPKVNCVVWMKADKEGRLFHKKPRKNKSGQKVNEQQGYHPKDLMITRIYLHCIEAGFISPQKAKYGDTEPSGKDLRRLNADLRAAAALLFDEEQAPWWKPPPKVIQKKKECVTAGLSKANRRVLQRWRKQRRGEQPASGSGSAPPAVGTKAPRKLVRNRAGGYGCPPGWIPDTRIHKRETKTTEANKEVRHPGVTSKSAPSSGRDHDAHLEEAVERLAAREKDERARLERQSLSATIVALAPPPPRIPPPAAQGSQRSRSPRQRGDDTRRLCVNGCGRAAATGFAACCRTCSATGGTSHGPRCNAAFQQVNKERPWRRTGLFDE